jgi:hypothetical protein
MAALQPPVPLPSLTPERQPARNIAARLGAGLGREGTAARTGTKSTSKIYSMLLAFNLRYVPIGILSRASEILDARCSPRLSVLD